MRMPPCFGCGPLGVGVLGGVTVGTRVASGGGTVAVATGSGVAVDPATGVFVGCGVSSGLKVAVGSGVSIGATVGSWVTCGTDVAEGVAVGSPPPQAIAIIAITTSSGMKSANLDLIYRR